MTQICNPSFWVTGVGVWRVSGQPGMYSKTLSEEDSSLCVQTQLTQSLLYLKKREVCFPFAQTRSLPMSLSPNTQSINKYFTCNRGQQLSSDLVQAPVSFLLDFIVSQFRRTPLASCLGSYWGPFQV